MLSRALSQHGDIDAALAAYVAARQPRTARVALQSRQQFANNRKVPPPPFLDRSRIFSFDVTREEGALQSALSRWCVQLFDNNPAARATAVQRLSSLLMKAANWSGPR